MALKRRAEKVVLLTGAAGGIGAASARVLAEDGWTLALHYSSNAGGARALLKELRARGAAAELFREDLLKDGAAKSLVSAVLKRFRRLDALVNNAGAVLGVKNFLEIGERDWDRTLRLNLTAPFLLAREAFKAMRGRGGRIVNVSSIAAKFGGSSRSAHYAAAKAGLESVTIALARYGAEHGILTNVVRPGVIDTPFHGTLPKNMAKRVAMIPLKRIGRPEEVALQIGHLLGPGGDFITGQVISVTGGE